MKWVVVIRWRKCAAISATNSVSNHRCQHNPLDQSRKVHDQRMELALTMTAIEEQYVLEEYDTTLDLFSDYQEMVIQFG